MVEHKFGRFLLKYDPEDVLPVRLYDETYDMIDWWDDLLESRMDIEHSPVGDEITIEQWQGLWDWVENQLLPLPASEPLG